MEKSETKVKALSSNRLVLPCLFIVFAIILELVNFLYLGFTNSQGRLMGLPTYFLFDLAIIVMIAGVIYVSYNKIAMQILYYLFLTIQFLMNIVNSTMYYIFGDILSFDLLKLGAEATTAITVDFIDWKGVALNVAVFAVMVTISILVVKYNKTTIKIKNFSTPYLILAVFILAECFGFTMFQIQSSNLIQATSADTEIETSDEYLWNNFQFKTEAFKKFGHYGFYTKSVLNLIFGNSIDEDEYKSYQDFIDSGYVEGNTNAPLYGDNLIVVLCESLDWYAIDPINTPTLWNMVYGDNAVVFDNFYARNRTNISEGIVLNGSMPKDSLIVDAYYNGYTFDYSLPNIFKSCGGGTATTTYVHANNKSFYDRDVTHTNDGIGFDNFIGYEDYTGEYKLNYFGDWFPDLDFTSNVMDYIIPDSDRFFSFIATLSTHGPYDSQTSDLNEYYQLFEQNYDEFVVWFTENTDYILPSSEYDLTLFKNYKAAIIDLDKTVENLIQELDNRGRADDTSILLFADHNSYYSDLCYKIKGVEKSNSSNTYINNIPMIFYSPKYVNGESYFVSDFCNTYDILPTLCYLYGLPSNANLYQGYNIFSSQIQNSFFASNLSGMFTEYIYSSNISDVVVLSDDVTESDIKHFKNIANRFYEKQYYIEKIYKNGINGTFSPKSLAGKNV